MRGAAGLRAETQDKFGHPGTLRGFVAIKGSSGVGKAGTNNLYFPGNKFDLS